MGQIIQKMTQKSDPRPIKGHVHLHLPQSRVTFPGQAQVHMAIHQGRNDGAMGKINQTLYRQVASDIPSHGGDGPVAQGQQHPRLGSTTRPIHQPPCHDLREKGFYQQLAWAVNQLSIGFYGWREGRLTEIRLSDGFTARLAPDLNAGTAALQYYFAQFYDSQGWLQALDPETGFPALYEEMFGNPWIRAQGVEPLYPPDLVQPPLSLPFTVNQIWGFTGGPHGAWERDGAWAAIDFAPGSEEHYCFDTDVFALASAPGLVTRSENGLVALDLDGDGREQTGWVMFYLHLAKKDRVPAGTWVEANDPLGHPSCEGGRSTGTHIHLARKYNGEWIVADGPLPFDLGGWVVHAGEKPYEGYLSRGDQIIRASQLSPYASRVIRGPDDP